MSDEHPTDDESPEATDTETQDQEQEQTQSEEPPATESDRTISPDDKPGGEPMAEIDDQFSAIDPETADNEDSDDETSRDSPRQGPLKDIADSIDDRQRQSSETDRLFEEKDIPEIDTDVVWEQLEQPEPIEQFEEEPEVRVVDKKTYCETCEYFSSPPDMHCTHDGTEIRELVDFEHVEVVNCPIVKRNEELEQL